MKNIFDIILPYEINVTFPELRVIGESAIVGAFFRETKDRNIKRILKELFL